METGKLSKYRIICFTDAGRKIMERLAAMAEGELAEAAEGEPAVVEVEPVAAAEAESAAVEADPAAAVQGGTVLMEYAKCHDAKSFVKDSFRQGNVLIFVGAVGIAVRLIAPYIKDKTTDPAVIVIDENGEFVIPILSGHIGGGVKEARKIALFLGAVPVITTATDVRGVFAVDVFAAEKGLYISDLVKAKEFTADLLKNGSAAYYVDRRFRDYIHVGSIPEEIREVESADGGGSGVFCVSPRVVGGGVLTLVPRCIVAGIGCRKGTERDKLLCFARRCMEDAGLSMHSLGAIASIDLKAAEEGLCGLGEVLGVPFVTFSAEVLMAQEGDFGASRFVESVTGADNVCERAVAACGCGEILVRKTAEDGMTFAAGIREVWL